MDVYALTRKPRPAHLTLGQNQGQLAQQRPISPNAAPPSASSTQNRALSSPVTPKSHGNSPSQTREVDKAGSTRTSKADPSSYIETVTGPPTRKHWQPDSSATKCFNSACPTEFSLFERRHHCRCCGQIFCAIHCSKYIRLDQNASFHPTGILSRACDTCAVDSERWLKGTRARGQGSYGPVLDGSVRSGRKKSVVSLSSSGGSTVVSESVGKGQGQNTGGIPQQGSTRTKRPLMGTGYNGEPGMKELGREDVVRPPGEQVPLDSSTGGININFQRPSDPNLYPIPSVPANWQWSTF